jgi:ribosomal protein L11
MADIKISALTAITGANTVSGDLIPIVDTSASETKSITRDELAAGIAAALQESAIADISTDMSGDANDNELKGKVNAILAALRSMGVLAS